MSRRPINEVGLVPSMRASRATPATIKTGEIKETTAALDRFLAKHPEPKTWRRAPKKGAKK